MDLRAKYRNDPQIAFDEAGRPYCRFCGGNCGQCSLSFLDCNRPASMQTLVNNLYGDRSKFVKRAGFFGPIFDFIRNVF